MQSQIKNSEDLYVCSNCGSRNTDVTPANQNNSMLGSLLSVFGRRRQNTPFRGQVRIKCKDCGHESQLAVN